MADPNVPHLADGIKKTEENVLMPDPNGYGDGETLRVVIKNLPAAIEAARPAQHMDPPAAAAASAAAASAAAASAGQHVQEVDFDDLGVTAAEADALLKAYLGVDAAASNPLISKEFQRKEREYNQWVQEQHKAKDEEAERARQARWEAGEKEEEEEEEWYDLGDEGDGEEATTHHKAQRDKQESAAAGSSAQQGPAAPGAGADAAGGAPSKLSVAADGSTG